MQSSATTVAGYLKELAPERRSALEAVRRTIKDHLPSGYVETMQYGMIGYVVPLKAYPAGYLGKKDVPLPYVCLASQKNHMAIYLTNIYGNKDAEGWFRGAFKAAGKKLDMGKSCVRFRKLEDLPLDVVAKAIALTPVAETIAQYERARAKR